MGANYVHMVHIPLAAISEMCEEHNDDNEKQEARSVLYSKKDTTKVTLHFDPVPSRNKIV